MIEQRRAQRFEIQLPVEILRSGAERFSEPAHTRNISSGGVMLISRREVELGGPIEYVVSLTAASGAIVKIRCLGKVMRMEPAEPDSFAIAATLERYEFVRPNGQG